MTRDDIEAKVKTILAARFNVPAESISGETRLAEDLGADSFAAVEVLFELEEAFGLKIPDSDIEQVRKVNDIVEYLQKWRENPPT